MSSVWEDFKKSISEWGIVASEKAEEFTHKSRLRLDILQLERKLSSLYVKLGLYVFNKTQDKNVLNFVGDKRYLSLINDIVVIKKRIKDKKDEINNPNHKTSEPMGSIEEENK